KGGLFVLANLLNISQSEDANWNLIQQHLILAISHCLHDAISRSQFTEIGGVEILLEILQANSSDVIIVQNGLFALSHLINPLQPDLIKNKVLQIENFLFKLRTDENCTQEVKALVFYCKDR